jgi:GTP diphosphokinase / guanosine-3',5'-bis(diphosphate) 3'-diphosphatase
MEMIRQYELVDRVRAYNEAVDEELLNRAYVYAMRAHGTQKRASGDPYFMHPIAVAAILTDLKLDDATIAAALLHDTIEDTEATKEEITRLFGEQIAELVDGLTKLKKLDLVSKRAEQAENLRKLLLAITKDVRVLLVKLADRLHNMRTLHYVPPEKRLRIAQETLDIYGPLAGRMGMQDMRDELEELAFKVIQPQAYSAIIGKLAVIREKNAGIISEIEQTLTDIFAKQNIKASVKGREKKPYSIFRKTERKAISFEQLSDIIGFRVVVGSLAECYGVLGLIHTTWQFVPGRFKDYISTPKQNDYRSIHTTFVGPARQRVEVQIRTNRMDSVAEYGIAAHVLYKDGAKGFSESRAFAWLRSTVDTLIAGDAPEDFLENTRLELFHDQVFCFTPKGLLITLPMKATPLDFAYAVHTNVGDKCVGCKINGKLAPLQTPLENGDEVEILTDPAAVPYPAMESFVITGRARQAIRRATKSAARKQYAGIGRQLLEQAVVMSGRTLDDGALTNILRRLGRTSIDDVYMAVGRKDIALNDVMKTLFPNWAEESLKHRASKEWVQMADEEQISVRQKPLVGISSDLHIVFDEKAGAVPGDRIVGILEDETVTIYPVHAKALAKFESEPSRWMDVRWDILPDSHKRYATRIAVKSRNKPGSLAQIAQIIADHDGNIHNIGMSRSINDFTSMLIELEVWDYQHLSAIINGLRARDVVADIERVSE